MPTHLVWFRADLRLRQHRPAAACRSEHARVLALFIATPGQWQQHDMAPTSRLSLFASECPATFAGGKRHSVDLQRGQRFYRSAQRGTGGVSAERRYASFYNYQYEFNEQQRDRELERILGDVECQGFDDSVMLAPAA